MGFQGCVGCGIDSGRDNAGDLENGQPIGVSSNAFRGYLLGDGSFLALLAIQSAILFTSLEMGLVRFLHQHPQWVTILHRK